MMIGYDIYDHFTIEHFPLHQRMTLTTKIYCSQLYHNHLMTFLTFFFLSVIIKTLKLSPVYST
jgi:hypothetical protein